MYCRGAAPAGQRGGRGVLPGPGNHSAARVDMTDGGSRGGAGQRGCSRVPKEVQHLHGPACRADLVHRKVPVHRLLREHAGVLEAHRLELQRQFAVMNFPHGRDAPPFLPRAAARRGAAITRMRLPPARIRLRRFPDNLRIRANEENLSPALQPFPAGGINQLVILPLCGSHGLPAFPKTQAAPAIPALSGCPDRASFPRCPVPVRPYLEGKSAAVLRTFSHAVAF